MLFENDTRISEGIIAVTSLTLEARIALGSGVSVICSQGSRLAVALDAAVQSGVSGIISFGVAGGTAQAASGMEAARSSIWLGRNSLAQAMPQTSGGTAISVQHAYAVAASALISTE